MKIYTQIVFKIETARLYRLMTLANYDNVDYHTLINGLISKYINENKEVHKKKSKQSTENNSFFIDFLMTSGQFKTYSGLAHQLGYHHAVISRIRNGSMLISEKFLLRAHDILKIPVDEMRAIIEKV